MFCYLLGASLRNIVIYSDEHKLQHPRTLLRVSLELKCVIVSDIPLIFCENFVISEVLLFLNWVKAKLRAKRKPKIKRQTIQLPKETRRKYKQEVHKALHKK